MAALNQYKLSFIFRAWLRKVRRPFNAATIVVFSNNAVHLENGRFEVAMVLLFSLYSEIILNQSYDWCRLKLKQCSLSKIRKFTLAMLHKNAVPQYLRNGVLPFDRNFRGLFQFIILFSVVFVDDAERAGCDTGVLLELLYEINAVCESYKLCHFFDTQFSL